MNKVQRMVILGVALAFAAGGSVGMLVGSDGPAGRKHARGPGRGLTRELDLAPEQQEQMREIWSAVMSGEDKQSSRQRRQELDRRREESIQALLTDRQRVRYEEILSQHARATEEIHRQRRERIEEAVERTKAILTEAQARKDEEIRKNRRRGPFRGGRPGGSSRRGWRGHPRTRPSAETPDEDPPSQGTESDGGRRPAPAARDENLPAGPRRSAWAYSYG